MATSDQRGCVAEARADGIDDGDRLVLRPGADDQLDRRTDFALRAQALVRLEADRVALDQAVGGRQHVLDRAEVLLDAQARRRPGSRAVRVVDGRAGEAPVELGEGGEAGAAEAVDRLVVVAHDHHVVGPVRRPTEQLDQLDLGDVGVLELVHQDVAELALPAAQDVRARLEELGHGGDLLAEVEGARCDQRDLVGAVDGRELQEAHDLERGAVADVGVGEVVDLRVERRRSIWLRGRSATGAVEVRRASRSAVFSAASSCRARRVLPAVLRPLVAADARVGLAHLARARPACPAVRSCAATRVVVAVPLLEDPPLLRDEARRSRRA